MTLGECFLALTRQDPPEFQNPVQTLKEPLA
jgi:hypothetical protein